jgi:hypothetical protein
LKGDSVLHGVLIADILKVYWMEDSTLFPPMAALSCARDPGRLAGKI